MNFASGVALQGVSECSSPLGWYLFKFLVTINIKYSFHKIHERLCDFVDPLEWVDKVGKVHGVLHPLHKEVRGLHGQVAESIVSLK